LGIFVTEKKKSKERRPIYKFVVKKTAEQNLNVGVQLCVSARACVDGWVQIIHTQTNNHVGKGSKKKKGKRS